MSEDHLVLQLVAAPNMTNYTLPQDEQYNSTLTITTRNGNMSKSALGKKKESSVGFTWSFLHEERLILGELMEIYSRVVVRDKNQMGKNLVQIVPANVLKNSYGQNLALVFVTERIRFNADEQIFV